MGPFLKKAQ